MRWARTGQITMSDSVPVAETLVAAFLAIDPYLRHARESCCASAVADINAAGGGCFFFLCVWPKPMCGSSNAKLQTKCGDCRTAGFAQPPQPTCG
jgi:hypothetical protein